MFINTAVNVNIIIVSQETINFYLVQKSTFRFVDDYKIVYILLLME